MLISDEGYQRDTGSFGECCLRTGVRLFGHASGTSDETSVYTSSRSQCHVRLQAARTRECHGERDVRQVHGFELSRGRKYFNDTTDLLFDVQRLRGYRQRMV